MKKKILSPVVVAIIFVGISLSTINANATPTTDVETARSQYEELNKKINDLNEQIQKIDAQISPLVDRMNENQKQIDSIKVDMDNTNKQIDQTKGDIVDQEEVVDERLRAIYKSGGETTYLAFIFSARSLSDIISNISAAKRIVNLDNQLVEQLKQKKDGLDGQVKLLKQQSDQIVSLNNEINKQKTELENKKAEQQNLINKANIQKEEVSKTFLAPSERDVVSPIILQANNPSLSSEIIRLAITELTAIRDNQLKSPDVIAEVNAAIETAQVNLPKAQDREKNDKDFQSSNISRGTTNASVQAVIYEAMKHEGQWYEWGATGPDKFDCSGFTSYCYKVAAGIDIGRTTYDQIDAGREVTYSELQPGDLIFPHAGHVCLYIGNGLMIHAPQTGEQIKVSTVYKFWRARRIIG